MGERKGHSAQQIDLRDSYHSDSDPDGRQVKSRRAIRLDPVHCHPNHLIHTHRDGITYWRDDNRVCYGKSCSCDENSTSGITTDIDASATTGCLHLAGVFPGEVTLTGAPIELLLSLHYDNRRRLARNEYVTVQLIHAETALHEDCNGYFDRNPYSVKTTFPETWREPGKVWLKIVRHETGLLLGLGQIYVRSPQQQQKVASLSGVTCTQSRGWLRGQLLSDSESYFQSPPVSNVLESLEPGRNTEGNKDVDSSLKHGLSEQDHNYGDGGKTNKEGRQRSVANAFSVHCTEEIYGNSEETSQKIATTKETRPTDTGLRLPPTGNLSSAMGMKLMLEVKCGKITAERAIEEFRDEWNIISQILSTKQRKKEQLRNKLSKLASLRKGVAKLKMPFSRREGEDSTSPDENGDKKREKRETKRKPEEESIQIRQRMFTVSSNETNTSERTRSSEDAVSTWSAPEDVKDCCLSDPRKKTVSLPRNARLNNTIGKKSKDSCGNTMSVISQDSGVFDH